MTVQRGNLDDPHPRYDPDLCAALERGGERALREAREHVCMCGHSREDHAGATGALASFGASACDLCWACPTFRAVELERYSALTEA